MRQIAVLKDKHFTVSYTPTSRNNDTLHYVELER